MKPSPAMAWVEGGYPGFQCMVQNKRLTVFHSFSTAIHSNLQEIHSALHRMLPFRGSSCIAEMFGIQQKFHCFPILFFKFCLNNFRNVCGGFCPARLSFLCFPFLYFPLLYYSDLYYSYLTYTNLTYTNLTWVNQMATKWQPNGNQMATGRSFAVFFRTRAGKWAS